MRSPVAKDLVLVGGGHSHVAVLKKFGMRPVTGLRITMISRHSRTPYSGMLPGTIAGFYTEDDAHIDLVPLCRFARARFIRAEVTGLDLHNKHVGFADRPPLSYDVLSINSGATPSTESINEVGGELICVKPIDRFLAKWRIALERFAAHGPACRLAVVGGGAGGVELAMAIERRMRELKMSFTLCLLTDEPDILMSHNPGVRTRIRERLSARNIEVQTRARVVERTREGVKTEDGEFVPADEVFAVTHASAADWIRASGLAVDPGGFVLVDEFLRSISHRDVFAAGDIAAMRASPRPKSGVFAVRQGVPLALNLRRSILGLPLRRYRPQRHFLSLIGTADGSAVASRGRWCADGPWVWTLKDWIDRRFMRRYTDLPEMDGAIEPPMPEALRRELPSDDHDDGMRCGGCGAKLGASALSRALQGLETVSRSDVIVGLNQPDDAALIRMPPGMLAVVSVDAFRPLIDDPYLFGRIAANHCLNDLYAVGAAPQSALAIVTLPVWPEHKLIEELRQMLQGAVAVLSSEGGQLVGGHTAEGAELCLGFSVTGLIDPDEVLGKRGLQDGDKLILTKPLGTGAIFAADMRARARGTWVDDAVSAMLQSNRAASECLRDHGANACTDVTGFGLAGHLAEMTGGEAIAVALQLDSLPLLAGAELCIEGGWTSTLHQKNVSAVTGVDADAATRRRPRFELLFDPQTAGGLLAGVPAAQAEHCIASLHRLGYLAASIVGSVATEIDGPARIQVS